MEYNFHNLVFEGGGVKGVAYVGAMEILEEKRILKGIERIGGTSAGAINALLIGLNYSSKEVKEILINLNFTNFLDDSWGIIRDSNRLINKFGFYKGNFFRQWVSNLIASKTGSPESTFADLFKMKEKKGFRDLYFIGTNLSTGYSEVFSYEYTPRVTVADAVRISMSIPLFFAAKRNIRGDIFVDGGLLNNYPIKLFDRRKYVENNYIIPDYYADYNEKNLHNETEYNIPYVYNQETLGFRLDSEKEIALFRDQSEPQHHQIDDFFSYTEMLIKAVINAQANQHMHSDDWQRTIYIDTLGISTIDFEIELSKKENLIESGRKHTLKYFEWYDKNDNRPTNKSNKKYKELEIR